MTFINSIQLLRGIAALTVALFHTVSYASHYSESDYWLKINNILWTFGNFGVDLFFVISGFIMFLIIEKSTHVNQSPSTRLSESFNFLVRRTFRIFPLYWLVLTIAILVSSPIAIGIGDFLLIRPSPHLSVSWTLVYEIRFYLIVAIIFLIPNQLRLFAIAIWGITQIAYTIFLIGIKHYDADTVIFDPLMIEFTFGIAAGFLIKKPIKSEISLFSLSISIGWLISSVTTVWVMAEDHRLALDWRIVLYGIPSAIFLYGLVSLTMIRAIKLPKILIYVGDRSYSIYLLHMPIILITSFVWSKYPKLGAEMFLIACWVITLFISGWSYSLIEKPGIALGRKLGNKAAKLTLNLFLSVHSIQKDIIKILSQALSASLKSSYYCSCDYPLAKSCIRKLPIILIIFSGVYAGYQGMNLSKALTVNNEKVNQSQIYWLYQAALSRPPNESDFRALGHVSPGKTANSIVSSFELNSKFFRPERERDFVENLYQNALGRQPDPEGMAFWSAILKNKEMTRADVLMIFAERAHLQWCNM